ncbi:MAG TPA: hypothetical protein VFY28_02340 [Candidatus Paceibacterota bacterium]|nr:hypothetical protein [Candidatus Paceibacterota bacterium]
MKEIAELQTLEEIEERIDLICRHRPELRQKAQAVITQEEIDRDPKLAAVAAVVKRRQEIEAEIVATG